MKKFNVLCDTVICGAPARKGDVVKLSPSDAKIYLKAKLIASDEQGSGKPASSKKSNTAKAPAT